MYTTIFATGTNVFSLAFVACAMLSYSREVTKTSQAKYDARGTVAHVNIGPARFSHWFWYQGRCH